MATASLPIESRPMPWRIVLAAVAAVAVAGLVLYSLVVGFGSSTSSTNTSHTPVTTPHTGVTSFDSDLYNCKADHPC